MKRTAYPIIVAPIICLALLYGCKKQPVDLPTFASQASSIEMYNLDAITDTKHTRQDLENASHTPVDLQVFRDLAPQAKFKDENVFFKGSRLAIVTMEDGTEKHLALSYYGGFFAILGEPGYYYFEGEARKTWEEAIGLRNNSVPRASSPIPETQPRAVD